MITARLYGAVCACLIGISSASSHAAFYGRLPSTPGGSDYQAYYDDQLNVTWTTNANMNGLMTWHEVSTWLGGLSINGVTGWQLPSMDVNGSGIVNCQFSSKVDCLDNQYGHLYYYGEGSVFGNGITSSSQGVFSGVADEYWSSTYFVPDTMVETFNFTNGQGGVIEFDGEAKAYAWAVYDGDVGIVPIPPALWLFGSGLLGLVGMARRKQLI